MTADGAIVPAVDPVLRCTSLDAGYHRRPVVRNLNLEIRPGEVLSILGSNGGLRQRLSGSTGCTS